MASRSGLLWRVIFLALTVGVALRAAMGARSQVVVDVQTPTPSPIPTPSPTPIPPPTLPPSQPTPSPAPPSPTPSPPLSATELDWKVVAGALVARGCAFWSDRDVIARIASEPSAAGEDCVQECTREELCTHFFWDAGEEPVCYLMGGARTQSDAIPDTGRGSCGLLIAGDGRGGSPEDGRAGSRASAVVGGLVGAAATAAAVGVLIWQRKFVARAAGAAWRRGGGGGGGAVEAAGTSNSLPAGADDGSDGSLPAVAPLPTPGTAETETMPAIAIGDVVGEAPADAVARPVAEVPAGAGAEPVADAPAPALAVPVAEAPEGAAARPVSDAPAPAVAGPVVGTIGAAVAGAQWTNPSATVARVRVEAAAESAHWEPRPFKSSRYFEYQGGMAAGQVQSMVGPPPSLPPELWSTADVEELGQLVDGLSVSPP